MSNRIYGYVGINNPSEVTNSSVECQKKELILDGVKESNIIIEIGSVINEIRCARNTLEFLKLQDSLFKRKTQFISLDLPYYNDSDINKLISLTLSSIAEFETNRRKKTANSGYFCS